MLARDLKIGELYYVKYCISTRTCVVDNILSNLKEYQSKPLMYLKTLSQEEMQTTIFSLNRYVFLYEFSYIRLNAEEIFLLNPYGETQRNFSLNLTDK